jgi:hypothetical protein
MLFLEFTSKFDVCSMFLFLFPGHQIKEGVGSFSLYVLFFELDAYHFNVGLYPEFNDDRSIQ